eukprot:GEMP01009486.1.p1 GENE.GEMP01009486.1~~GEMP01009486.1.p1  ORF type:complete len:930 (+),score=210.00 GEMP01009486.1:30-2819(+)
MGLESRRDARKVASVLASASSYCREFCVRLETKVPNFLHSTFDRDATPAEFLRSFVRHYDKVTAKVRKPMLKGLLRYIEDNFSPRSPGSSFEAFQKQRLYQGWQDAGLLILLRIVAHLSITLPRTQIKSTKCDLEMLHLQVRVIKEFLSLQEKVFADAFFDCGASFLFLKILSPDDFNIGDDLRSLALDALLLIARRSRAYKEALCDSDLLAVLEESMEDTLDWNTLPKFCNLLCEIFRGNPRYQKRILSLLEALFESSAQRVCSVATRSAVWALNTIITEAPYNSHLQNEIWIHDIFRTLLGLLDGEPRLSADIVSLLCQFVKTMPNSARHLFDFCREHMMSEQEMEQMAFRLERDAYLMTDMESDKWILPTALVKTSAFGGRIEGVSESMKAQQSGALIEENSELHIVVRWRLIIFLCKHNKTFCEELVADYGLTDLFLLNVFDMANPLIQQSALEHLHLLRLYSTSADSRVIEILIEPGMFGALSLDELMRNAPPSKMRQARFNLRSARFKPGVFSAVEFLVYTGIITSEIDDLTLLLEDKSCEEKEDNAKTFFITETDDPAPDGDPNETSKPRDRSQLGERLLRPFPDVPLPFHAPHEYRLRLPPVNEMRYCRHLSMLADPLENQRASLAFPSCRTTSLAVTTVPLPAAEEDTTVYSDGEQSIDMTGESRIVPAPPMDLSVCVGTVDHVMSTLAASLYRTKGDSGGKDISCSLEATTTYAPDHLESWEEPSTLYNGNASQDLTGLTEEETFSVEDAPDAAALSRRLQKLSHAHTVCTRVGKKTAEFMLPHVANPRGPLTHKVLCLPPPADDPCRCVVGPTPAPCAPQHSHRRLFSCEYADVDLQGIVPEAPLTAPPHHSRRRAARSAALLLPRAKLLLTAIADCSARRKRLVVGANITQRRKVTSWGTRPAYPTYIPPFLRNGAG